MGEEGKLPGGHARFRRLIAAAAAVAMLVFAGAASASTWKAVKLSDPGVQASLYGVSCASPGLCVATGANSTIATSTDPAGDAGAWTVFRLGGYEELPGVPGHPGSGDPIFAGAQIRGVSCPSTGLCVAASFDGRVFTSTSPAGGPGAWRVAELQEPKTPRVHAGGVSCPTPSLCVAVAYAGKIATTTDPTGGRSAWAVTELSHPFDLRGVSCPSAALCVAVGNEGNVLASANPAGGAATWNPVGAPLGPHSMNGISCPAPTLCVTGSAAGVAVSTNPTGGAWRVVSPGTGLPIKGMSCASTSACAGVDNNADVIASADPTRGSGAWWFKNVLPFGSEGPGDGNGMFGISCPATTLCVAAGQDSQIITSTDPFVEDGQGIPARRGSKRLRVVITHHPPKRLEHRKGGVRVTFRFRAVGGRARRFLCKHRREGRYRRCRSPRRFRIGGGKQVFKVRAVAAGGRKSRPAAFHFRVGRLTERPPYGSCRGGSGTPVRPCIPSSD